MSEPENEDVTEADQEELEERQRKPASEGGVPNKETGAGLGAGRGSTFEGEEDSDTTEGT